MSNNFRAGWLRVALRAALAVAVFSLVPVWHAVAGEEYAGEVLKVDVAIKKLTVKKNDGNRFTFVVNDRTAFTGVRKSLQDLTKGDHVTVEFQTAGGQYTALRVATP
jgi:Cu/Ag efflux protein CusF